MAQIVNPAAFKKSRRIRKWNTDHKKADVIQIKQAIHDHEEYIPSYRLLFRNSTSGSS